MTTLARSHRRSMIFSRTALASANSFRASSPLTESSRICGKRPRSSHGRKKKVYSMWAAISPSGMSSSRCTRGLRRRRRLVVPPIDRHAFAWAWAKGDRVGCFVASGAALAHLCIVRADSGDVSVLEPLRHQAARGDRTRRIFDVDYGVLALRLD